MAFGQMGKQGTERRTETHMQIKHILSVIVQPFIEHETKTEPVRGHEANIHSKQRCVCVDIGGICYKNTKNKNSYYCARGGKQQIQQKRIIYNNSNSNNT
mmetsp:Transcript_1464/g.2331  ORF Transcript_1464/g.2331 Transcript_1464/m.2331 type:complete len:100 (-) Transcript_1464:1872-2171(-)